MATIPAKCQPIADELKSAQELVADLQQELKTASDPRERTRVLDLLKAARAEVSALRTRLDRCVNPPAPRPDLSPVGISVVKRPDGKALDTAAVVTNKGQGPARGPFKIALGVEFIASYGQDPPLRAYREAMLNVPASVTIPPGANYTSDFMKGIPIVRRPGSSMPATFDYDVLVDVDQQVSESVENNNYLKVRDHRS